MRTPLVCYQAWNLSTGAVHFRASKAQDETGTIEDIFVPYKPDDLYELGLISISKKGNMFYIQVTKACSSL
jgi:hypothetical protein